MASLNSTLNFTPTMDQMSLFDQQGNTFKSKVPPVQTTQTNFLTYPQVGYTGADCKIYFGDIWVDDVITIQYNLSQTKVPIYGYASQYFDAIAKGQVIVEGSLAINFREVGYLNLIQAVLDQEKAGASNAIKNAEAKATLGKYIPGLNYIGEQTPPQSYTYKYSPDGSPSVIKQQQTIEQILASKKGNSASAAVAQDLGIATNDQDFEDFANILQDTLWGNTSLSSKTLKRADEFDYNQQGGITTAKNVNYANVLNIMLIFGDINDYKVEHTVTILNDVHFNSNALIVAPNGEPIAENYTFIARAINHSIDTASVNINPVKLQVGFNVGTISTAQNMKEIEDFLQKSNVGTDLLITLTAALGPDGWKKSKGSIESELVPNLQVGNLSDQVISAVERAFNSVDPVTVKYIDTTNTQYIAEIDFGGSTESLNVVLEQSVPGTRTYHVIAPSRNNFSTNIITRDGLLNASSFSGPSVPLPSTPTQVDKSNNKNDAAIYAANASSPTVDYSDISEPLSPPTPKEDLGDFSDQELVLLYLIKITLWVLKKEQHRLYRHGLPSQKDLQNKINEAIPPVSQATDAEGNTVEQYAEPGTSDYEAISNDITDNQTDKAVKETNKTTQIKANDTQLSKVVIRQNTIDHQTNPGEGDDYSQKVGAVDLIGLTTDASGKEVDAGYAPAIVGGEITKIVSPNRKGYSGITVTTPAGDEIRYKELAPSFTKTLTVGNTINVGDPIYYADAHYHAEEEAGGSIPTEQFDKLAITHFNALYYNKDLPEPEVMREPSQIELASKGNQ